MGASYTGKSGQANLAISYRKGDSGSLGSVEVQASCDSLQLVCEEYLQIISSLQSTINQTAINEDMTVEPSVSRWKLLLWFIAGAIVGTITKTIIQNIRK